jgi:hypothetical protein
MTGNEHPYLCVRSAHLHQVAATCATLTPVIERHADALLLDLTGCERALGIGQPGVAQWRHLAAQIYTRIAITHQDAVDLRLALAPSGTVAWLAAAESDRPWRVVMPATVEAMLRSLPAAQLLTLPALADMPAAVDAIAALAQGGIHTVGQLARLAPSTLQRRFGLLGGMLARLATGQNVAPLRTTTPACWLGARHYFDLPATLEECSAMVERLAAALAATLCQRHQEAGALRLVVHMTDQPPWRATRPLNQTAASPAALADQAIRLLGQVGAAQPAAGQAIVSAVSLGVGRLRAAWPHQVAWWPAPRAQRAHEVARRLAGRAALYRAEIAVPHAVLPEERYAFRVCLGSRTGGGDGAALSGNH